MFEIIIIIIIIIIITCKIIIITIKIQHICALRFTGHKQKEVKQKKNKTNHEKKRKVKKETNKRTFLSFVCISERLTIKLNLNKN